MNTHWIRSIRRACAEHSAEWDGRVIARVDRERRSICPIEPREHEHFVADTKIAQSSRYFWNELEPRARRSFVSLLWRLLRIAQW